MQPKSYSDYPQIPLAQVDAFSSSFYFANKSLEILFFSFKIIPTFSNLRGVLSERFEVMWHFELEELRRAVSLELFESKLILLPPTIYTALTVIYL